ncbi:DUF3277 domain-containing protein [Rahnella sp. ChDrAdgB13]|uniref:DUF3277 domain-containing protein n=1 Tax=Rahnella sp. ChDrAdgB13 TaxID=1850581 RepID=UPI001AD89F59|nr:DUF3277 domain-containing protein [Rahnella sp. ChDrAdgB13]
MLFDIKQIHLMLNERSIEGFTTDTDAISLKNNADLGEYTVGVHDAVWVANPDGSGILVMKMLQHHSDNAWLSQQAALQRSSIKSFTPFSLIITDLLNEDVATGSKGYFTTLPTFLRGAKHNPNTWAIGFKSVSVMLAEGLDQ